MPISQTCGGILTGCVGAALMAGVAAGAADDLEAWATEIVNVAHVFAPDPDGADRLDGLHAVYRATYQALEEQFRALAGLARD